MSVAIRNQVALVIGASSGIGRETAILLARQGARVMASARREDRLRTLQAELPDAQIEIFPADATRPAEMEKLVRHTRERWGDIDVLVYATGTNTPDRSLKRLNPEIWDTMIGVNLNGAYYATQAALPAMRERGAGHLIYIASTSALGPDISGAAYQASKRGLLGLAHAVRFEEKGNGIRTCVICPGLVDTELLEKRPVKPAPELLAKALQPIDIAEAVLAVAQMPPRVTVLEMHVVPTLL
jgi:serine 3-dehydrogenase (NADP+)